MHCLFNFFICHTIADANINFIEDLPLDILSTSSFYDSLRSLDSPSHGAAPHGDLIEISFTQTKFGQFLGEAFSLERKGSKFRGKDFCSGLHCPSEEYRHLISPLYCIRSDHDGIRKLALVGHEDL
jgi:hypothetical protein